MELDITSLLVSRPDGPGSDYSDQMNGPHKSGLPKHNAMIAMVGAPMIDPDDFENLLIDQRKQMRAALIDLSSHEVGRFALQVDLAGRVTPELFDPNRLNDHDKFRRLRTTPKNARDVKGIVLADLRAGIVDRLGSVFDGHGISPEEVAVYLEPYARRRIPAIQGSELYTGPPLTTLDPFACGLTKDSEYEKGRPIAFCKSLHAVTLTQFARDNPKADLLVSYVFQDTVPTTNRQRHTHRSIGGAAEIFRHLNPDSATSVVIHMYDASNRRREERSVPNLKLAS